MDGKRMKPRQAPRAAILLVVLMAAAAVWGGGVGEAQATEAASGPSSAAVPGEGPGADRAGAKAVEEGHLPADLRTVVDGIQARYEALRDFRARFTQQSRLEAAPTSDTAKGEVFFQKPGKMRWNYETPEPQEIVINGGTLWQYVPADKQVVVQSFDTSRVEYAFLTGLGDLEKQFRVRWAEPKTRPDDPLLYLELVPRDEQASFAKVVLGVESKGYRILATEVTGIFGNVTSIRFHGLRDNVPLKSDEFVFKPPAGVEVIDARAGAIEP
jgi:outer membrane lipoprotein carrier protein